MTKKKRGQPDVEEILSRPWCYYCERDFDDLKILINHQKAKHFKCERCGRRLNTAGGLSVHMSQVHKENLTAVDNALPNRAGLDIEIFGMEGIPDDISNQHYQRVLTTFHQAEADRRAGNGNAAGAAGGGNAAKKPKFESPSDLKKRLAEHKAKLAAEQVNGGGSGRGTPDTDVQTPTQSQDTMQAGSPPYPSYQQPYSATPVPSTVSYGQPTQYAASPVQASPFQQQPPVGYPPQPYQGQPAYQNQPPYQSQPPYQPQSQPPFQNQPPYHNQPPYQNQPPFQGQPQYQGQPPYQGQPQYQPQGQPPYQQQSQPPFQHHNQSPYQAHGQPPYQQPPYQNQGYQLPPTQNGLPQVHGPPNGQSRPFGAGSPNQPYPHPFQQQQQQQQRTHTPPQTGSFPQRTGSGSLPAAPGLPQRPAFGAPQVNAQDFQRMHQGQTSTTLNGNASHHTPPSQNGVQNVFQQPGKSQLPSESQSQAFPAHTSESQDSAQPTSLDDLISSASKQSDVAAAPQPSQPAADAVKPPVEPVASKEEAVEDKSAKKEKEKDKPKTTKLIYSDNNTSPEEKMAKMPRYAYTPEKKFMV